MACSRFLVQCQTDHKNLTRYLLKKAHLHCFDLELLGRARGRGSSECTLVPFLVPFLKLYRGARTKDIPILKGQAP